MDFRNFVTVGRYERIQAISTEELDRRFSETRKLLQEKGADALILTTPKDAGFGMWLSGDNEASCLILGMQGPAVAIYKTRYTPQEKPAEIDVFLDPSEKPKESTLAPQVINLNVLDDEAWDLLALPANPTFALIGGSMKIWQKKALDAKYPDAAYQAIDNEFKLIKAYKSPFEQELYMESAKMTRKVIEAIPSKLYLGQPYREVAVMVLMDTQRLWSYGDGLAGLSPYLSHPNFAEALPYPGARIEKDDIISILLETSGPGGYYTACARFWSYKEPDEEYLIRHQVASEANALAGSLMKPGVTMRQIADQVNEYIRSKGFYTNDCCYLHSMGYNMCEPYQITDNEVPNPRLEPSENEPLVEGMISLAHPMVGPIGGAAVPNRFSMARFIDSYCVTKDGGKKLTDLKEDLYVL